MAAASKDNEVGEGTFEGLGMMMGVTVSPGLETQTLLSSIYPLTSVREIGTDKFMMAYCVNLERLSIQAHMTARVVTKERSLRVNVTSREGGNDAGGDSDNAGVGCGDKNGGGMGALFGANRGEEEYIVEAFLENSEQIDALVRTLLALELWRDNVLFRRGNRREHRHSRKDIDEDWKENEIDREACRELDDLNKVDGGEETSKKLLGLAHRLASNGNALRLAFILHVETTIVSLLNLIFYRGIPPELLSSKDETGGGRSGKSGGDDGLLSLIDYCARQLVRIPFGTYEI